MKIPEVSTLMKILIKCSIGFSIIFFIFWLRFLRQYSELILQQSENIFLIARFFCMSIIFNFLFIRTMTKFLGFQSKGFLKKIINHLWYKRLMELVNQYILETPQYLYNLLTVNINLKSLVELPASYFTAYFNYPKFIVISFYFVPLCIVATTFLIDIFVYQHIKFFYKGLLLLIPLLFMKIIIYIFFNYSKRMVTYLEQFINVIYLDNNKEQISLSLKAPGQMPLETDGPLEIILEKYDIFCQLWFIYHQINEYMQDIQDFNMKYISYILLYTYCIYAIGWTYALYLIV